METGGSGPRHPTLALRICGKLNVLCGWGKKAPKRRSSAGESPLESRGLRAATYPDTSPVTSSSPHGLRVGRGQMVLVAWRTSLVGAPGSPGVPLKSFALVKGQIDVPAFLWDCGPENTSPFSKGSIPGREPSCTLQVRVDRLGGQDGPRDCGDPGGPPCSQHLSLALPPRRRMRQPALRLPAPARPHIADATGAPFPAGAGATLTSLLRIFQGSPSRRSPSTSAPCSRFLPAGVGGSLVHLSRGGPAGKLGAAQGAQTVLKGTSTHQRG